MQENFRYHKKIEWNREKLIMVVPVCVRGYQYIFGQNKKDLKSSLFTAPCRPIGDVG